jgi:small conductance mechanosensitive channel
MVDMQNIIQSMIPWLMNHGIKIILIFIGAGVFIRILKVFIEKGVRKLIKPDQVAKDPEAEVKRENTLIRIFNSTVGVFVWAVAFMMILTEFGIDAGPLIGGAAIMGVAIGFGAQYMVRDFLSGLFIMLENQYRVGDVIKVAGIGGKVEDITLRKTVLRDIDGVVHHVPNGEIKVASNKSQEFSRVHLKIGVAYKEDIDRVSSVLSEFCAESGLQRTRGRRAMERKNHKSAGSCWS